LNAIDDATTKKVVNFWGKKCTPRENPGYTPMTKNATLYATGRRDQEAMYNRISEQLGARDGFRNF